MRSSTPHLMLAICTIAVQAAPISPAPKTPDMINVMARGEFEAPKTPDMITVMARGEFEARDTLDTNNLDVNDYRRRSISGFPGQHYENEARPNVRRSISGYMFPADSTAVGKRDEAQSNPPAAHVSGLMSDSDADSGFNSDSASDSGSGYDSDSDDDNLGPRDVERYTHVEARYAPENPTFPAGEDSFDDMFEADADDEFDDELDDDDLDSQDVEAQHVETKRSANEFSEDPEALDRRDERSAAAQGNDEGAQTFDSDFDFDSDIDFASDSDA